MTSVNFYEIHTEYPNFREISESRELVDLVGANQIVALDIYAAWCQPCKYIAPKFKELSKSHTDIMFAKINIESFTDQQVKDFGVTVLPTFLFFKAGRKVDKVVGANISDVVDKIMSLKF
jgi:thioredoxin 1